MFIIDDFTGESLNKKKFDTLKNPSCQDHFSIGISPESIKTFYPLVNNIENIKNIKNIESIENTAHKEVEGKSFDDVKFNINAVRSNIKTLDNSPIYFSHATSNQLQSHLIGRV